MADDDASEREQRVACEEEVTAPSLPDNSPGEAGPGSEAESPESKANQAQEARRKDEGEAGEKRKVESAKKHSMSPKEALAKKHSGSPEQDDAERSRKVSDRAQF